MSLKRRCWWTSFSASFFKRKVNYMAAPPSERASEAGANEILTNSIWRIYKAA